MIFTVSQNVYILASDKVHEYMKRIFGIAKTIIFLFAATIAVISLLTILPLRTPIKPFIVLSGSMRPWMPEGSIVFVRRNISNLKKGDIITFKKPGDPTQNITHRIIDERNNNGKTEYQTKGDANNAPDSWALPKGAIWGKALFAIPLLGYVIQFSKTKLGSIVVVAIPLILIVIHELWIAIGEIKRIIKKKKKTSADSTTQTIVIILILTLSYTGFIRLIASAYAKFTDTITSTHATIETHCWESPTASTLLTPADLANLADLTVNFAWLPSSSTCPDASLTYNLQVYTDSGLTTLYQQSGFAPGFLYAIDNMPEGQYWWRVVAKDQYNNESSSSVRTLTIDRTSPLASLEVTGSGYKAVEEKITNGDFEDGTLSGFTTHGDVDVVSSDTISTPTMTVDPANGSYMARIGSKSTGGGHWVWDNRLMQSIISGAKSFSLSYNFVSRDFAPFDDPGFFIRLNGAEIFRKSASDVNPDGLMDGQARATDWQQFTYNLSHVTGVNSNLAIYAGNSGDTDNQSWVYIDKLTTYFITAKGTATYRLSGTDGLSGVDVCEYAIDDAPFTEGSEFQITTNGTHHVQYRCQDNAGNYSPIHLVTVITDIYTPSTITDLAVNTQTYNTVTLQWTAPGNDGSSGRAASYDIRYATTPIFDDATFLAASQAQHVPSPKEAGQTETFTLEGLNPATLYYIAIKSSDEAPNESALSNIAFGITDAGDTANPGDVIINELMWMGTSTGSNDEWLELRNLTDRPIDLSGWQLTKNDSGSDVIMYEFPSSPPSVLAPLAYTVVGHIPGDGNSALKTNPEYLAGSAFSLSNSTLLIKLFAPGSILIDQAWDGTTPLEGYYDSGTSWYSMERTGTPGDGTNPLNWYTCIDSASTSDFFDSGNDERGTPGWPNRSENEPTAHAKLLVRPSPGATPTPIPTPSVILTVSDDRHTASFTISNIEKYTKLNYQLTYDSDNGAQGIMGDVTLKGDPLYTKSDILFGTCSTGGTCVYHTNVHNIVLSITLVQENGQTQTLETTEP